MKCYKELYGIQRVLQGACTPAGRMLSRVSQQPCGEWLRQSSIRVTGRIRDGFGRM